MKSVLQIAAVMLLAILDSRYSPCFAQGSLTPPGALGPTMLTLSQIEPRTPISSVPFTITNPGAYYLTGNLYVTSTFAQDIIVKASQVTIDLNGFAISNGVTSENVSITSAGFPEQAVTVRNGAIINGIFGINLNGFVNTVIDGVKCQGVVNWAILVGPGAVIRDCAVLNNVQSSGDPAIETGDSSVIAHCAVGNSAINGGTGILTGRGCVIDSCTINSNYTGIVTGDGATVKNCSLFYCGGGGVQTGAASTIADCSVSGTGSLGPTGISAILTGVGCTINGCTVVSNSYAGITTGNGCTISGCTAMLNTNGIVAASECTITGCTVSENNQDGIQAAYSCLIQGNTCSSNSRSIATGGAGIHALDSGNRIDGNVLNSNQYGIKADGSENLIIRNAARDSITDNYDIVSDNMVDTIIFGTENSSPVIGTTGGTSLGTTDPWANFSF